MFGVTSILACHLTVDSCENCFNCWKSLSESEQLLGQLYCSSALGHYAFSSDAVIITVLITGVPPKLILLLNPHRLCCSYILRGLLWSEPVVTVIFACRCLLIPLQTSLRMTLTIVSPISPTTVPHSISLWFNPISLRRLHSLICIHCQSCTI